MYLSKNPAAAIPNANKPHKTASGKYLLSFMGVSRFMVLDLNHDVSFFWLELS